MTTDRTQVAILGSTGSIGAQALEVIEQHPDRFVVTALAAGRQAEQLDEQAARFGVSRTGMGAEEATRMAELGDIDVVLNAIVGATGLRASIAALRAGKTLALANKESLVAGGELCLRAAREGGGRIVPVDSEHAALAQCLAGCEPSSVERVVLTASGGPFRERVDLTGVTPQDALAHPTWAMGPKITIDSATLMNKGLEVIEAHHLFGFAYDRIGVVVHPQSIVHAIVELVDGSSLLQAAPTDMRVPILAALSWPDRVATTQAPVDLASVGELRFEALDSARFPSVGLAYAAGRRGGTFPAVLNAANEQAVAAFLDGGLAFTAISQVVEDVLEAHDGTEAGTIDDVLAADSWARGRATELMRTRGVPMTK